MSPLRTYAPVYASVTLAVLVGFGPCLGSPSWAGDISDALRERLSPAANKPRIDGFAIDAALLGNIYRLRDYRPIWVSRTDGTERAALVARRLGRADEDGLIPGRYAVAPIFRRIAALDGARGADNADGKSSMDTKAPADLDLLLTDRLIRFTRDLRRGRVAITGLGRRPSRETQRFSAEALIDQAKAAPDMAAFLAKLAPANPRYRRLKSALAKYRTIAAQGGWPRVPKGPTLKPGRYDPRAPVLRERLRITGDLARVLVENSAGNLKDAGDQPARDKAAGNRQSIHYDTTLEGAVKRFQRRHGLDDDGAVGRRTLAALNMTAARRVRQIEINLERRRHLNDALGDRYVFVNIADASVKYVERRNGVERTLLAMRAVVGRRYRETPVFTTAMTHLQVNPSWYVPATIANEDLLPRIRKDPEYLARGGYEVLTGGGRNARILDAKTLPPAAFISSPFPYLLRQRPGLKNALGRLKFVMPNRHSVYLHDTPLQALMTRAVRTFSSGCIRLEKPVELASLVMKITPAAVRAAIAPGKMAFIPLNEPVAVHIAYLTAWANKDGGVHFRNDIYGRDRRLAKRLLRGY